jgi:hypothetical protein
LSIGSQLEAEHGQSYRRRKFDERHGHLPPLAD